MRLNVAAPYWAQDFSMPSFDKLDDDQQVDVVVIGAGITGLTAAYLLTAAGKTVAVLERGRCAEVDTGPGAVLSVVKQRADGRAVEPGLSWRSTRPAQVLQFPYFEAGSGRTFDIASDGRRFLVIKPGGDNAPQSLVVVQNWFQELKRRVPANR